MTAAAVRNLIGAGPQVGVLYPGSLFRRYIHAAWWSTCGAVAARALNLVAFVAAARLLGPRQFGAFTVIQSTAFMFSLVAAVGFGVTASRYTARFRDNDPDRVGRILGLASATSACTGALAGLALILFAPVLARDVLSNPELSRPLAFSAVIVFMNAVNGYQTGALAGFEAFKVTAKIGMWSGIASVPCVILGALSAGVDGAVIGLGVSFAVAWTVNRHALRATCRTFGIRISIRDCWREASVVWHFALPALLSALLVAPANWYAMALLARQPEGYLQLALFGAADRWRLVVMFIPTSIFSTVVPLLSNLEGNNDHAGISRLFRANVLVTMLITVSAALVIMSLSTPMMKLFGRDYAAGWPILALLAFTAIPQALNTVVGQRLILKSMWARFGFDCLWGLVLILAALIAVPRTGALGLAGASAVAYSITVVALFLHIRSLGRRGVLERL